MCTETQSQEGEPGNVIVCICRGANDSQINKLIDRGASSLRDLQRCGIGDQCGSCHNSLRTMLAAASAAEAQACPACALTQTQPEVAVAMA